MNDFEMLRRALGARFWAIHEPYLRAMVAALPSRIAANLQVPAPKAARVFSSNKAGGGIALVPIHGVIEQRGGFFSMFFGGCSCEMLTEQLRQAVNDPNVSAIVLDVDSPGGDVSGVDELAQEIYNARKVKPITAVSNCLMASAAYYLASQASEVIASPSSLTGSIGVYTTHEDDSEALDNMGVKMTLISYGANKTEGNSYEPLSDSAREHMQEMVDSFGNSFEKAVARGRGVKQDEVQKKFGQGRVFPAAKAVKLGMADRVGTLDDALGKHGASRPVGMRGSAFSSGFSAGEKDEKDTKRVDGKDCPKSSFAYRPDDKKENWKLLIESPDGDEEWEKSHIRNAISRWSQTDMPDAEEKSKARKRVKAAAKKHDIEVGDDSLAQAKAEQPENVDDDDDSNCACACADCKDGDCDACTEEDCTADGCMCDAATKARRKAHAANQRRIELASL
jgi:signal peptide peptidase SppA